MLTRLSSAPVPFRAGPAWEEIERICDSLNTEGQRQMLAHARALAEVHGRLPPPVDDRQLVLPC
jgi:hypothetical protein